MKKLLIILLIISPLFLLGQNTQWQDDLLRLNEILSIPNNSNKQDDIQRNLEYLQTAFSTYDFETKTLSTDGKPLFFAKNNLSSSLPTILFYMHIDGQPVDPNHWAQDNPYNPVFKFADNEIIKKYLEFDDLSFETIMNEDIRVYARSASDDKGPIAMFLSALDHLINANNEPTYNVKVIIDTEEEIGSPHLSKAVAQYSDDLKADYFVVFDGPLHASGKQTLLYGVRGITRIHMEIYGSWRSQHSGHFGNYAPNPVNRAADLISSMKDSTGRVLIDGFYDGISLNENIKNILEKVPDDPENLRRQGGFAKPERVGNNYQEAIQYPSLNINGIKSGWVNEQTRTIVPEKVILEMDIRTVPEVNADSLIQKLKNHIKKQGFTLLADPASREDMLSIDKPLFFEYNHLMYPFRTSIKSDIGNWLRSTINSGSPDDLVEIRISGGSVPLSFFINELSVPTILVPLVNPDNNQHSPNENLKISNYFKGIETVKKILTSPPPYSDIKD